jgi:hypothetical protein
MMMTTQGNLPHNQRVHAKQ